jgi:hypothetical protein
MNKIYIINNELNIESILYFDINKILINNTYYNFEIIDKNYLIIYWDDNLDIEKFYTDDSYLYFSIKINNCNSNNSNNFIKYFLIHNEWYDQIILNINDKSLFRFSNKDEKGIFILDNNKLIVNWNNWDCEVFLKIDDYSYVKENIKNEDLILLESNEIIHPYNISDLIQENNIYINGMTRMQLLSQSNESSSYLIPIYIFIHICTIENWKEIFEDQILILKNSGLYYNCTRIYLSILGIIDNNYFSQFDEKINILYNDTRIFLYEIPTINLIKQICENNNDEIYILYIHTKGVRKAGNNEVTISWRKMMEYFLIENWKNCIYYLNKYDTLGNNLINDYCFDINKITVNKSHAYHYSGNFWWSKKSHIDKLPYLNINIDENSSYLRYIAENWILSNYPDLKYGVIFQDNTNIHPYHRYVFDYYRKMKFIIKDKF